MLNEYIGRPGSGKAYHPKLDMKKEIPKSAYSYFEANVSKYAEINNLSLDQSALHLNRLLSDQNDTDYWKRRAKKDKDLFVLSLSVFYCGVVALGVGGGILGLYLIYFQ